ncbi:hypothetical protein ES702_00320 [subsurface metagenome]
MYDDYDEEEIERFGREGGGFLLLDGIIDTDDIEEIKRFKENVRKSNKFNILKLNERSDDMMFENYELKDLIEEFHDEIDEDIKKALKEMPEKLKEALEEAYKILNEYKADIKEIPGLFSAVQLLGRLATGKPGLPGKYPYPSKKVKKSMPWEKVQDLLFGGHIPADDEEIEKSSRENPFPSITRAIKIKKEAIDEIEEEMEEGSNYDDEDE